MQPINFFHVPPIGGILLACDCNKIKSLIIPLWETTQHWCCCLYMNLCVAIIVACFTLLLTSLMEILLEAPPGAVAATVMIRKKYSSMSNCLLSLCFNKAYHCHHKKQHKLFWSLSKCQSNYLTSIVWITQKGLTQHLLFWCSL